MPRIRALKPDFFKDEDLACLPFELRMFFAGLWLYADREGRLEDRPKYLKAELFPYDKVNTETYLEKLAAPQLSHNPTKQFIRRYCVAGKNYIQIVNFSKHQRPHHLEPPSIIPPDESGKIPINPDLSGKKKINPLEIGREGKGTEIGREGKAVSDKKPIAQPPTPPPQKIEFKDRKFKNITYEDKKQWAEAYPALNIDQELARMEAWVVANPENRKSNWGRFIVIWLTKSQDRAPTFKKPTYAEIVTREKELEKKKREDNKPIPGLVSLTAKIAEEKAVPHEKYEKKAEDCTNLKKVECQSPYCPATCRFRESATPATEVRKATI